MTRKFQIGVMGSAADLKYAKEAENTAYDIGKYIAEMGGILFYGAEKDSDSLSTIASRGAKSAGGLTVAITYGKGKDVWGEGADVIIPCGLERGGGRETVLVTGCDAIIAIGGGSGTLTELAIAYQADIPTVALEGYGGWADKLANDYIDDRKRQLTVSASSARSAVEIAFAAAEDYRKKYA
jgi:uncharacterized protein (TIGR00725 family)